MLNKCIIMGRLTAAPELRYTQSQTPVVSFTIAADRDFTGKDKEKKTDFISCVAWRNTAEFISKYFHKGSMAVVAGSLQSRQYEKNGDKRTAWEVLVENIYFADSKKADSSHQNQDSANQGFTELGDDDGELPF